MPTEKCSQDAKPAKVLFLKTYLYLKLHFWYFYHHRRLFVIQFWFHEHRLIDYMPLPPATEDGAMTEVPNLEFTKVGVGLPKFQRRISFDLFIQVECLMFAFHSIGRQDENFLKSDDERLKDFRSRLQYLARGVQGYIKKLKEFLAKPTPGTGTDYIKIKQIALRTNENIQVSKGSFQK